MRRTAAAAAAAATMLGLGGCGDTTVEAAGEGTTEVFAAPPGHRWVGINGAMVAVPKGWRTSTTPCGEPDGPVVHFPGPRGALVDCSDLPTRGVSSVTVATVQGGQLPPRPMSCRTSPQQCSVTVVDRDADAAFRISARGREARRVVGAVRGSLTGVPDGYTAVRPVGYGISVESAERLLQKVGLAPTSPTVDFPHYATGTEPVAGTVVPDGSTVRITIGDG